MGGVVPQEVTHFCYIGFVCSPSVLDRLNPLLEPAGVLSMDERGVVGGTVPVIKPHPHFR